MSEWWGTIGQPFAEALLTLDTAQIKEALINFPHTYYEYIHSIYLRSPEHVIIETFLIVFVVYITVVKKDKPTKPPLKLSDREVEELINEWEPEPLVPRGTVIEPADARPFGVLTKLPDTHLMMEEVSGPVLNLATFDFLGLGSRPELKQAAIATLTKYGCGSCGPRGFYGTIDVHEKLEKDIAQMMGTPDSILFSDSEATSSSVLPAFARRGDLIVMDEGCNDSLHVGANLARCQTHYYKHNDLNDLERVLQSIRAEDKKLGRKSDCQRRYVVTEALFRNHGDMIDLPKLVAICDKYFFHIFLDESFSFGVLGARGTGITEHYNVPVTDVSIICSSLAGAPAGVGGFSTGRREVVDYQRINSASYVFSASSPPFTATCTSEALRIMQDEPQLFTQLRENAFFVHDTLSAGVKGLFALPKDRCSPVIHMRLLPELLLTLDLDDDAKRQLQADVCEKVMQVCLARGVAVCAPRYKRNQVHEPMPSVRVTVMATHQRSDLQAACKLIAEVSVQVAKDALQAAPQCSVGASNGVSGVTTRQRKGKKN